MSLFLSQQKIPYQSVSRFLRAFAPSCDMAPAQWAASRAADLRPGDLLVVFDVILSPFGDSTAGIGVAEDDSFKAAQLIILCGEQPQGSAIVVSSDGYQKKPLDAFLASEASAAKDNGSGFYYAIVRPQAAVELASVVDFAHSVKDYGGRADGGPDVPFAFFRALGLLAESPAGIFDIMSFGYHLFLDKEPPPASKLPDLRSKLAPVGAEEQVAAGGSEMAAAALDSPPAAAPVAPQNAGSALPKMPSFFSQPKVKSPLSAQPPTASTPPPLPSSSLEPPSSPGVVPPPVIRKPDASRKTGGQSVGQESPGPGLPPPLPERSSELADLGRLSAAKPVPIAASDVETMEHNTEAVMAKLAEDAGTNATTDPWKASPEDLFFSQPPATAEAEASQPAVSAADSSRRPRPGRGELANLLGGRAANSSSSPSVSDVAVPEPSGESETAATPDAEAVPVEPSATNPEPPFEAPPDVVLEETPSAEEPVAPTVEPRSMVGGGALDWSLDDSDEPSAPSVPQSVPMESLKNVAKPIHVFPLSSSVPPPPGVPSVAPQPTPPRADTAAPSTIVEPTAEAPEPVEDEPPMLAGAAAAVPQIAPLPPRKRKVEPSQLELARQQVKEPPAVKSGVAGLVSKLEQQASRASMKLEQQVDDIQNRLSDELRRLLHKVEGAEKRSFKSAEGLRINLTHRMENATNDVKSKMSESAKEGALTVRQRDPMGCKSLDDKNEELRSSLSASFADVRACSQSVAKSFDETIAVRASKAIAELEAMREASKAQLQELHESYERSFQASFEHLRSRLDAANTSIVAGLDGRFEYLQGELADMQHRCQEQLLQTKTALVQKIAREITVGQTEISRLQSMSLEENVLPRLRQHREELRVITSEFQQKLTEDLEKRGETKVAEFQPLLEEKKRRLVAMQDETNSIKSKIQDQLKSSLESIFNDLTDFVTSSIEQAQTVHKQTEERLTEIDRAVRALADPSSIEGDMELLSERNDVLDKIEEVTEEAKDEVLGTLRRLLAGLEEKSKQLQEEMITSMEEDAFVVRRASEQALFAIKEAINESFVAIQTAQDERMPM